MSRDGRSHSNPTINKHKTTFRRYSNEADDILIPRPSILLPQLQDTEQKFFELVSTGDVLAVKEYLDQHRNLNINCTNFQGVTALLIAVHSHAEPMVEFLLTQPGIEIGDCVLHAVKDNQPTILKRLLDKLNSTTPSLEFIGVTHSNDFADYITPLILAAQCGHYEIIKMLIERGHTISKPHPPTCRCTDCRVRLEHDDLLHAESLKLNLYRAVSNPAYICYSTHDPILAAFYLSKELEQCSFLVPEFRIAYMELSADVSDFAVDLIACCRSTNEMELILMRGAGIYTHTFMFPRLVLAMDCKQKKFVAHPNTQQIVEAAWCGDWHEYKIKGFTVKLLYPIARIITLPVITVMCIITPHHQLIKHWSIPLNKMISHIAAYVVFLMIIFIESNMDKTNQRRKPPNSGLEPVIIIFVIGHTWNIIRMMILSGPSRYFQNLWNWHAVINNMMFLLTFTFWLASYFDAVHNDQVDLERKYWHHLDPVLIAEGCFAIATIMAFFRLTFFCRLNYYMGPLQISLGKMCADLAKYLIIFVIVIISFSAGCCRLYQYYDGMVKVDENQIKTQQVSSFVDFASTIKTFFWAILCMAPLESADVVIENLPGETPDTTIINTHEFTEAVGYIAFAFFEVLIVIMILNMLIATMSATFQRVIDNLDVEWTFGKTDFYLDAVEAGLPAVEKEGRPILESFPIKLLGVNINNSMSWHDHLGGAVASYVHEIVLSGTATLPKNSGHNLETEYMLQSVTPSPLNLIPTPFGISNFLLLFNGGKTSESTKKLCDEVDSKMDDLEYPALMTHLVQRYFREKDSAVASASEMDILRQEIHELKVLLNNIIEAS